MEGRQIIFSNQVSPNNPDWERFNTCRHRSEFEQQYTTKTCCMSKTETGFICYKIPINGVQPYHCRDCPVYEPKE